LKNVHENLVGVWHLALDVDELDNVFVFDLKGWNHEVGEELKILVTVLRFDFWKHFIVLVEIWSNKIKLLSREESSHLSLSLFRRKSGVWIGDFLPNGCLVFGSRDICLASKFAVLSQVRFIISLDFFKVCSFLLCG